MKQIETSYEVDDKTASKSADELAFAKHLIQTVINLHPFNLLRTTAEKSICSRFLAGAMEIFSLAYNQISVETFLLIKTST